ncbi:DUF72 domain-containing protein [Microbulbifer elongatus]|uniref:DUF72 domain-containing protein n=1 Tax=Microbulbifer elongatus TaxID=86173 RepID=A0ABT1P6D7_9GAMM|nr:DUF72 domain-containing protein [Microbulbifer elongatus]MCQ3830579.1 DUF72 domain-containing protein [Microbulbifer elongatus]
MDLPYFLGCPQWQHPAWNTRLPAGPAPLERYSQVLNCVEGNTTFYATPSQAQCVQWRRQVSDDFRFLLKFPRSISHDYLLTPPQKLVTEFLEIVSPLNDVLGPFLLQLPAAFGPQQLSNLWRFMDDLPDPLSCAVEVRHAAFFQKGDAERALNRGLRERECARVCLDSRGLFAAEAESPSIADAQRKKPKVPVHLLPVNAPPVIRYIGHPELERNREYLAPWVARVANWIEQGVRPYVFIHMPDNGDALNLVTLWTELLHARLPQAPVMTFNEKQPQLGLF